MRWLLSAVFAIAVLLMLSWVFGQQAPTEDELSAKVEALQKKVAQLERQVAQLEKRLSALEHRIPSPPMRGVPVPLPYLPPETLEQLLPHGRPGFGLPRPAPSPFVQPYYYPLER